MLSWSHFSEKSMELLAKEGSISFGTPIIRSIPDPEKGFRTSGSGLKIRVLGIVFDLRRETTVDGGGRLSATLP